MIGKRDLKVTLCSLPHSDPCRDIGISGQGRVGRERPDSSRRQSCLIQEDMGWGYIHRPWVLLELVLCLSSQAWTFSVCGLCRYWSSLWVDVHFRETEGPGATTA